MKTTTLHTRLPERDSPADCLAPAQAEAERMFGQGPARRWRPSPRWRKWGAWAAAGALVAGGGWLWRVDAGVDAHDTASIAALDDPALRATRPMPASKTIDDSICVGRGCGIDPLAVPIADGVAAAQVDPDAWALHPEPVQMAAVPGFTGLVNVPDVPDENDATPGVETVAEDAAGAAGESTAR
jgi:hypothetical protein